MNATYGLEYALFFGVPENKIELIDGTSRWVFPFLSRAEAETHFQQWIETFRRWKQTETSPPIHKSERTWQADIGSIQIELFPRPIEIRMPIAWEPFEALLSTFNRRDYWPGQPAGLETGWDSALDESDIRMNFWRLLDDFSARHGGRHSSRVDIALGSWAGVAPDAFYYCEGRQDIMIEGSYFCAAPDLVVEVLSAPSRQLDRGPRMEIYRRAGVPHLWLVEPALETVEVYEMQSGYELIGQHGPGDSFVSPLFPGEEISADTILTTQSKRSLDTQDSDEELDSIPDWIVPPETKLGLEYFFHLGHPERRWEFWNNRARSVLAFGSGTEANARLDNFIAEACRWESAPRPKLSEMADEVVQTEVGKFQFTRRGRLIFLDVAIDGRRHREILTRWGNHDAWNWGAD
jgi:hypothetical protein